MYVSSSFRTGRLSISTRSVPGRPRRESRITPQATREPWDFGRFVKTVLFFNKPPSIPEILESVFKRPEEKPTPTPVMEPTSAAASKESILVLGHNTEIGKLILQDLIKRGSSICVLTSGGEALDPSVESKPYPSSTLDPSFLKSLKSVIVCEADSQILGKLDKDVFSPSSGYSRLEWGPLDDVVMGGCSQSGLTIKSEGLEGSSIAVFSGNITSANNGGFASVRTKNLDPPLDLQDYDGLKLKIKGDRQRYKFMLRTTDKWDDISYCKSFDTVEGWNESKLKFSDFQPVFRAKTVSPPPPIDLKSINSFQIMLSKFEYDGELNPSVKMGRFELPIKSMKAYINANKLPKFVVVDGSVQEEEELKKIGVKYSLIDVDRDQEAPLEDSTLIRFCSESACNLEMKTGRFKEKSRTNPTEEEEVPSLDELLTNFES